MNYSNYYITVLSVFSQILASLLAISYSIRGVKIKQIEKLIITIYNKNNLII